MCLGEKRCIVRKTLISNYQSEKNHEYIIHLNFLIFLKDEHYEVNWMGQRKFLIDVLLIDKLVYWLIKVVTPFRKKILAFVHKLDSLCP